MKMLLTGIMLSFLLMHTPVGIAWSGVSYDFDTASSFNLAWYGSNSTSLLGRWGIKAGDLNGDGIQDIAMAEYLADTQGRTNNGVVYVIYGHINTSTGTVKNITSAFNVRIDGAENSANLGVVDILDVNGDNQEDIVLRGGYKLYFIYGPLPDGTGNIIDLNTSSNYNLRILGPSEVTSVGFRLADVNDDGDKDFLIEAIQADKNGLDSGSLYVVYGPPPGGTGNDKNMDNVSDFNLRFDGHTTYQDLGYVRVGDLNADGKPDIVIMAQNADQNGNNSGSVYVSTGPFPGTTGNIIAMSDSNNWMVRFNGQAATAAFGRTCEIADVNADGYNDIIIGAYMTTTLSRTYNGAIYVIYGPLNMNHESRSMDTSSNYNVRFDGNQTWAYLPMSMWTKDTNNDGVEDLVMTSRYNSGDYGIVYIVHGGTDWPAGTGTTKDMAASSSYSVKYRSPDNTDDFLGQTIILEDMDGDGTCDIVISRMGEGDTADYYPSYTTCRRGSTYEGMAYVFYGPTPAGTGNSKNLATDYDIRYIGACHMTGRYMAAADLDGDGIKELVISNSQWDVPNSCQGRVYLVSTANPAPKITSPYLFTNVTDPTVEWTSVSGATNYRIQVDETPIFSSPLYDDTLAATSKGLSGLTNAETYYARVKSTDGDYQRWGPIVTFTIDTTAPVPGLISPGDASGTHPVVDTSTPTFKWSEGSTE